MVKKNPTINLIKEGLGDVRYERTVFPDGENHIKFLQDLNRKHDYRVVTRITNASELFELMQVGNILNRHGIDWTLDILYLMSMRMDRVVNFQEAYTLEIVANIINGLKPSKVRVLEAHSKKTFTLIKNSEPLEIQGMEVDVAGTAICFPDAGSCERYSEQFVTNSGYIILDKVRDLENNGAIKSIEIEYKSNNLSKKFCGTINVVDDLCDAGGTFCLAANILREKFPNAKLIITVTHAVNPVGIHRLAENYEMVYITNSYANWDEQDIPTNVEVLDVVAQTKTNN